MSISVAVPGGMGGLVPRYQKLARLSKKNDIKLVGYTFGLKITSKSPPPTSFRLCRDSAATGQYRCFLLSIDDLCLQVRRADIVVVACGQTELVKVTIYFYKAFQSDSRMCQFIV